MHRLQPLRTRAWLYVTLLAVAVMAMVAIGQMSHRRTSPFARAYAKAQGDTLDIGIQLTPTIYSVRGDTVSGRDYDLLMRISDQHGVPMKMHPFVSLTHAMDRLDRGLYDMVVASMPLTSELRERFVMTEPVYLDREVLVQLPDSAGRVAITSQMQLAGDTVWIVKDSPIASRIRNLASEIGDTIYIESVSDRSPEHLFMLVAAGRLPRAVINEGVARQMQEQFPQVDISTPVSFTQFQSWAVAPSRQALADSINAWLHLH